MSSTNESINDQCVKVLLVDDQDIVGAAVKMMLQDEEGIELMFCNDPAKVIEVANSFEPTVILQDLVMPGVDGISLVRFYRANKLTKEVPVIVLSSKEEADTKANAFASGANDYLVKFPDKLEVIARVKYHSAAYVHLLERNKAQNELAKANRFIRKTFGQYHSDDIVDIILESPDGTSMGGEKRMLTIVTTDLRGFTSTSEQLSAVDIVNMLNIYLEAMTEIILKYQGTIIEFIGDAILFVFGAPIAREDDPQRAIACALEMQNAMTDINDRNKQNGYPDLNMGIGINTGEAVVGNIGSRKRTKYDVIGHNVNLAYRIESYSVGGQTFISSSTYDHCSSILRIDSTNNIMQKGLKEPMTVSEVGGIGGEYNVYRPEIEDHILKPLDPPLTVDFVLVIDKHVNDKVHSGSLIKLDHTSAIIQTKTVASQFSNIKLAIIGSNQEKAHDLYAKIIECDTDNSEIKIQFTSVAPETRSYLDNLLES